MIIDLGDISTIHDIISSEVHRYPLIYSIIQLKLAGLPVLDGFIVFPTWDCPKNEIEHKLNYRKWRRVLVRSAQPIGSIKQKPPGGNLFSVNNAIVEVSSIISQGRAAILLEPHSRLDNLYSGNMLFNGNSEWALVEIVGPGFDLSDLNRGGSEPHDRFELNSCDTEFSPAFDIRNRSIISALRYRSSRESRLSKLEQIICSDTSPAIPSASNIRTVPYDLNSTYHPIPISFISKLHFYSFLARRGIIQKCSSIIEYSIGFSIFHNSDLIFWDIFTDQSKGH